MPSPSLAILRTIPQRLFSNWMLPAVTLGFSMMIVSALFSHRFTSEGFNYFRLGITAIIVGVLALHAKQIVIDAKGRLLPRSPRFPLVAIGVTYMIGLPLLLHVCWQASLLGITVVIWLVAACVFHFVVRMSWISGLPPILFYVAALWGKAAWATYLAAIVEMPQIAWLAVIACAIWMILTGRQLADVTEESRGYQPIGRRQMDWTVSPGSTGEGTEIWRDPMKAKWLAFSGPAERALERATQPGATVSIWARCRRWRTVNQRAYFTWVVIVLSASSMQATRQSLSLAPNESFAFLAGSIVMPVMMALVITVGLQLSQWRFRTANVLKPQTREDFLREMGLSLTIDLLRTVLVTIVLVAVLMALLAPRDLMRFDVRSILGSAPLVIGGLVLIYGVTVWFARYRLLVAVGLIFPAFVVPFATMFVGKSPPTLAAWISALLMVLIGLALTRDAYRRWLLTDLA